MSIRIATAASSVLVALSSLTVLTAPAASAAPKCNDIEIVFARGTDEPAGLGVVGKALVDTLRPMVKGQSIGTYAVKYPASWDFLQVAVGANDASKRVQSIAATCPDSKIVLGGYSQGAAVIDVVTTSPIAGLGYTAPLPAAVVPHVAAVAVFVAGAASGLTAPSMLKTGMQTTASAPSARGFVGSGYLGSG